jgi:hypothetical protein
MDTGREWERDDNFSSSFSCIPTPCARKKRATNHHGVGEERERERDS